MPVIYEVWNLDRKEQGLLPWRYSGSDWNNNPKYLGTSGHKDYEEHCKDANLIKHILLEVSEDFFESKLELRKLESVIQKAEDHSGNPEYYNMTNHIMPDASNSITRKKISKTLKGKGIQPNSLAIKNAHSKEAIEKRNIKLRLKRTFYNPETLEYKIFDISKDKIPDTWISGRKPKRIPKTRDEVKYNKQDWIIYKEDKIFWEGTNLMEYCKGNLELKYLPYKKDCQVNIKKYKEHKLEKLDNKIYIDDKITNMNQKELSTHFNVTPSTISTCINKTNKLRILDSVTTYKAIRK